MGKWVKKKLGEYVVLQGGFAFQSKDFVEDGVPLIRIGDITKEGLCDENAVKLPVYFLDECKEFVLNEYDTIIAMSGATTGKCTIVSKKNLPALLNQRVGRFKIKNSSIDKLYLYYIVSSYYYQQKLLLDAIGGAQPNVSPRQIEKVICAFPILPDGSPDFSEQRRIASILSSADKVIDSTQKLIAKYKQIKQGMMEDLLKPKEGWKLVKLGECLRQKPDYGINAPAVEYDNNLPTYLRITDITEDGYYSRNDIVSVSSLDALNYKLEDGDLVFARTGASVGKTYLYNQKDGILVFAGFLIRVRTDEQIVLSQFFKYQTQTPNYKNWIAANSMRTGQPGINGNEYGEFTFYIPYQNDIPDLSEQRRIASILSGIDKKIESEEKVLEKYKKIKKGLMEKLLRGE